MDKNNRTSFLSWTLAFEKTNSEDDVEVRSNTYLSSRALLIQVSGNKVRIRYIQLGIKNIEVHRYIPC